MPTTKEQKGVTLEEVNKMFASAQAVVLSDFRGIKVEDITQLRRNVRGAKGKFKVVKNTLARRVFSDAKYEAFRAHLKGPNALAFGEGDPVELIKKLKDFEKANQNFHVRSGIVDGQVMSAEDLTVLATLPARPVLYAQLMSLLNAPISGLMGVMDAQVRNFLYLLKGIEDKAAAAGGAPETPAS
jgi:ribosomal protein L10